MPVRNPTKWAPPSGRGYISSSTGSNITTQASVDLTTQSGSTLTINPSIYKQPYATAWAKSSKNKTGWQRASGTGYIINAGNKFILTNNGFSLADNLGNLLATTTIYEIDKYATSWNKSSKNKTSWNTPSGTGFIVQAGTRFIVTNSGNNLVTNNGDYIVTTTTYNTNRYTTLWTVSGI